jgi:hypothetical protein
MQIQSWCRDVLSAAVFLLTAVMFLMVLLLGANKALAGDGKLIGTAGLMQVEGSGGGGLVPWATLAGYDSREQLSVSVMATHVKLNDYELDVMGVAASFYDRVELSLAKQRFAVEALGLDIDQTIVGLKYRLYGDVVYSPWPQLALGLQYKELDDDTIANALGAKDKQGTDFYLSAAKVHLGAIAGYNAVWNVTARATKANELGLLGFGGQGNNHYEVMLEASAGVLLSRHWAVGAEYRQKPDNLGLGEDDWLDFFVSYIPSKQFNVTLAWAELGSIANSADQSGLYLSLNGQLW